MNRLRELFPDQDYGFRMTMRRGEPADFFRRQDATGARLAERARWLDQDATSHAALEPEGGPLFSEANELGQSWGLPAANDIQMLARTWEPDILLLSPDKEGRFRLRGGALCFPTGWALTEKMGQTLEVIHGIVPGLNPAIGGAIDQFLHGLKPGVAFHRDNWGISASPELNLHPMRGVCAPTPPVHLDNLWLRVEHQALVALPRSRGILFGIRVALHRLDDPIQDPQIKNGLLRALRTMRPEMGAYKGLAQITDRLISLLSR